MKEMWKKAAENQRRSSVPGQRKPGAASTAGPRLSKDSGQTLPQISPMGLRTQSSVEDYSPDVDTDLYVGPVYTDDSSRKKNVIKEQLGEITQRLHKTLTTFDNLAEFEEHPHREMFNKMSRRISKLESGEMKDQLESFLDQYQNLSSTFDQTSKERDEILLDLADWFTTDHTDLDHKLGIDETEESDIKKSYVETLADFEKLKRLTESIKEQGSKGKSVKHLEEEKKKLEKNVMTGFKKMKTRTISIQTQKPQDTTWKYAADEIMTLITNVRTENSAEMTELGKKMRELLNEIERQNMQIKGLQSENRREKELKRHLADENSELNNDNLALRSKLCRYEKDLENAKKMLEKQFAEMAQKESQQTGDESATSISEPKVTVSGLLDQFFGEESGVRRMSSDPMILRTRIRELDSNVDQLTKELVQLNDKLEEMEEELERREDETAELQSENKHLIHRYNSLEDLNERLETEKHKLEKEIQELLEKSKSLTSKPSISSVHNCSHCNCHLKSVVSVPMLEEEPFIPLEKKVSDAEIQMLMDKCSRYKRTLAETELKLSTAYRDIAEMRLRRESVMTEKPVYPTPEPTKFETPQEEDEKEMEEEEEEEEEDEISVEDKTEKGPPVAKIKDKDSPKPRKEKPKKSTKPPKATHKRELPVKKKESPVSLPPIKTPAPMPREEPPEDKKDRDLTLWHVGDLQGRLNLVIQEIMEFVKAVGEVLHKEEADQASKLPTLTTFEFGRKSDQKKKKGKEDQKEAESRQRKAQIMFNGQRAVALMREVYDMLSNSLNLQHDEFETIYRSFKLNQHRRAIERAIMLGQLPPSALKDFRDLQNQELKGTYTITSYQKESHPFAGGINQFSYLQGGVQGSGGGGTGWVNPADQSASRLSIESEQQKLEGAVTVLGMHRSKSEIDIQSMISEGSMQSQSLMRERSSVFLVHMPDSRVTMSRKESTPANREEIKVAKTMTPKKGLIKLTSLDYELKNQFAFENKALGEKEQIGRKHRPTPQKGLIQRKDIANQLRIGRKLLEEQEKKNEETSEIAGIEKEMGEYTFADLQMNIEHMTDASKRRGFKGKIDPRKQHKDLPREQPAGLPSIKSVKPFT